jgi:response regulator RpfG family c-di-GMP phosphodiesterase
MKENNRNLYESLDLAATDFDNLFERIPSSLRRHSRRVAICCSIIAGYAKGFPQFYDLPADIEIDVIANLGGTLHDIGKLLLPAQNTTTANYRRHPSVGADFIRRHKVTLFNSEAQARYVIEAVRHHHEQPDGRGFPGGSKVKTIPFAAGICAVADKIDHLLYIDQQGLRITGAIALENIKRQSGTIFLENAVLCAEKVWPKITKHYITWNRGVK